MESLCARNEQAQSFRQDPITIQIHALEQHSYAGHSIRGPHHGGYVLSQLPSCAYNANLFTPRSVNDLVSLQKETVCLYEAQQRRLL